MRGPFGVTFQNGKVIFDVTPEGSRFSLLFSNIFGLVIAHYREAKVHQSLFKPKDEICASDDENLDTPLSLRLAATQEC